MEFSRNVFHGYLDLDFRFAMSRRTLASKNSSNISVFNWQNSVCCCYDVKYRTRAEVSFDWAN